MITVARTEGTGEGEAILGTRKALTEMPGSVFEGETASVGDKLEVVEEMVVDGSSGLGGDRTERGGDAGAIVDGVVSMAPESWRAEWCRGEGMGSPRNLFEACPNDLTPTHPLVLMLDKIESKAKCWCRV